MTLEEILRLAVQKGASDVHLKAGVQPVIRLNGILRPIGPNENPLSSEDIATMAQQVMSEKNWEEFQKRNEIDIGYGIPGVARFRVNVFKQRGTVRMVIRNVPHQVPELKELSLPKEVAKLSTLERGLVLVTGIAGSGKSTTLAAIINEINKSSNMHILTIEDPIEFLIRDRRSLITQREIGIDANSFAEALRSGLRQDPDIILIGEMRDRETTEIALLAAETGHLVFSTLHTLDSAETINRILATFETSRHNQIRLQLGACLRAVVSQRLCRRKDGSGYVPAVEILVNTSRIREIIENPEKGNISTAIEEGQSAWGMQSFDQSLMDLLDKDMITMEEALIHSTHPEDFRLRASGVSALDGKKWSRENQNKQRNQKDWHTDVELDLTSIKNRASKKGSS